MRLQGVRGRRGGPDEARECLGDFRVLVDWDKDNEVLYAIDAFERKNEYRELGNYREVWGSWRDAE